jgi:hypothetical protein
MGDVHLHRRALALGGFVLLGLVLVVLVAAGGDGKPAKRAQADAAALPAPPELPRGGRRIFPRHRIVAYYGNPADNQLGILGIGSPERAARRLLRQAKAYERKTRPVLPVMELISTVANADPGDDGLYRRQESDAVIKRYLRAARSIKALLVLDIQPGRADFMSEAKRLRRWLREPDVGLALDPEWHVSAPAVPGQVIGSVDGKQVLEVAQWLDELTERNRLPQKLLILHQFTSGMIGSKQLLRPQRNLATVLNADGFGSRAVKVAKYHAFAKDLPWTFDGFKLFYVEDGAQLMKPRQVLRLKPPPDVVVYE